MHDKSDASADALFALADIRIVGLDGRDAVAFAQAQFTNDVAALPDGHWHWSAWLTPKGRVLALFALVRLDAERLRLVLMDADPEAFAARLRGFVFRSKVVVGVGSAPVGAFASPRSAQGAVVAELSEGGFELDLSGAGGARRLVFDAASSASAPEDDTSLAAWRAFDLAHGLPRLEPSQVEQWTPQQLSLDRLRAYSVRKGCYPGQEIVARTHFLGQAKRGLARLRIAAAVAAGDEVGGEGVSGRVVATVGPEALAVLPLPTPDVTLHVNDRDAAILPLCDGLLR